MNRPNDPIKPGLILTLGALVALAPMSLDLYLVALPSIATDLSTSPNAVQLTVTATLVGLAVGQLLIGSVSDALGRRRPLLIGIGTHVLASLAISVVQNITLLIVLRFLQGAAAAAGTVIAIAMARDRYDGVRMGKVIARLMLVVGVVPCLAPVLGTQLLYLGSWRWMFLILAGYGLLLGIFVLLRMHETLPTATRRAGGVRSALRSYVSLLRDGTFMGFTLTSGLLLAALFTYITASSFVLQNQFSIGRVGFAIIFGSGALSITAGAQLNGLLLGRVRIERLLVVGTVAALISVTGMVIAAASGSLPVLVAMLVCTLFSMGVSMPSAPTLALQDQGHQAGSAAALQGAMQFGVGGLISPLTAVFGGTAVAMAITMCLALTACSIAMFTVLRRFERQPSVATDVGAAEGANS